jgi:hypothetical protein
MWKWQGITKIDIRRKPTTSVLKNNSSAHPGERKTAEFESLIHILHNFYLEEANIEKEVNTITNMSEITYTREKM